jgi:hypothetical protein
MSRFFLFHFFQIIIRPRIKFGLAAFVLIFAIFIFACNKKEKQLNLPPYPIGYIPFSAKLDDPHFKLCHDSFIIENGSSNSCYLGGVKSINDYFKPIKKQLKYAKGESGYLTLRFIMNCQGGKDRYRVLGISNKYKAKEFSAELTNTILEAVKQMHGWQVAVFQGYKCDSYNMLTFKIIDGQINDIIL